MQGVHLRKYNVQTTIDFEVYEVDGVDLRVDWVPAQADCEVMKDEGASTRCTNTATDEGSTYSIVLTATEMQAARLVLKVVDAATKVFLDKVIVIETYGNASAMHAFDLDTASVAQSADNETRLATIETDTGTTLPARFTGIEGATFSTATDSLEVIRNDRTLPAADYVVVGDTLARVTLVDTATTVTGGATEAKQDTAQTDLNTITGTGGVLIGTDVMDRSGTLDINTKTITANAITATAINADAITEAKIADNAIAAEHIANAAIDAATFAANAITSTVVADNTITAAKINADAITAAKIADDAIAAEHIATGAIVAATFAANAITSTVVADNTITAAKIGADAITNAKIADDAIAAENFATGAIAADAVASTALDNILMSDLAQGAPSVTASIVTAVNYVYEAWRNHSTTTATRYTLFKDDTTTELVRSTISDDATTFDKGEMATGV